MKKAIKVIRSNDRTIVIYSEPKKERAAAPEMPQKAILVRVMGRRDHYILPDGSTLPVRHGRFWRFIKLIRPVSRFAV